MPGWSPAFRVEIIPGQQFWMVKEMLFRPSFCANCGEKIDRAEWGVFTSRRFCQVCETEYKGQDLIPRFIVGLGVLIGVIGLGAYWKSGPAGSDSQLIKQPQRLVEQPVKAAQLAPTEKLATASGNSSVTMPSAPETLSKVPVMTSDISRQKAQRPAKFQAEPPEEVYYCGASTAKGTPCKHRVKGNVRCFQHVGMPAMLPPDKLRIK